VAGIGGHGNLACDSEPQAKTYGGCLGLATLGLESRALRSFAPLEDDISLRFKMTKGGFATIGRRG